MPDLPTTGTTSTPAPARACSTTTSTWPIRQLVDPWLTGSNGHADVACVEGDIGAAIGALGVRRARAADSIRPTRWRGWRWAGASGGAHGRRRGAASGRFGAWWTLAALGDLLDEWPVPPDVLGALVARSALVPLGRPRAVIGWSLQLAVEDPSDGTAWAIATHDAT